MKIGLVIGAASIACALLACAAEPAIDTQLLEQARGEVQTLGENPGASEVASRELANARDSLSHAETALKEKNSTDVDHYSYIAIRQAKTGAARVAEQLGRQRLTQFKGERERVLLEARNAELEAQSKLAAEQTERGMVLMLSGVLFDTGKATLKPGAGPTLDRVSAYLTQYPKTRLIVEGHTDNRGSEATNRELSQQRAQAVADALAMRGIPRERIDSVGRGPDFPVASNATVEGRQLNRRVEMVFSDDAGRFAEGAQGVRR
jgi:outer membrane protein OmpA-like peptidoglycan-associated protein